MDLCCNDHYAQYATPVQYITRLICLLHYIFPLNLCVRLRLTRSCIFRAQCYCGSKYRCRKTPTL